MLQVRSILLGELRSGLRRPGSPINVKDVAERLRLSGTPVREALERLVGEGMVMASDDGHGFAAVRLRRSELAGHHELLGLLVESAVRSSGRERTSGKDIVIDQTDPTSAVEDALRFAAAGTSNPVLPPEITRICNVVAPFRLHEPVLIRGWEAELRMIVDSDRPAKVIAAVRAFTRSRRVHASDIVDAAEQ